VYRALYPYAAVNEVSIYPTSTLSLSLSRLDVTPTPFDFSINVHMSTLAATLLHKRTHGTSCVLRVRDTTMDVHACVSVC
jgi:hypothetical protein